MTQDQAHISNAIYFFASTIQSLSAASCSYSNPERINTNYLELANKSLVLAHEYLAKVGKE